MPERSIITGAPGSDLTGYVLDRVCEDITSSGLESFTVIVPDLDFMELFKSELLHRDEIRGLVDNRFKTFRDFTSEILPSTNIIPVSLKRLILKDTLKNPGFGLKSESTMPGFRRRVETLFNEISQHNPDNQKTLLKTLSTDYTDGLPGNGMISRLIKVYNSFNETLAQRNYKTIETAMVEAAQNLSDMKSCGKIYVTGFHEYDESQVNFLKALLNTDCDICVTCRSDKTGLTDKTLNQLSNSGYEKIDLPATRYSGDNPVKNTFLTYRDEADFIAHKVAEFVENGYDPKDILIIHPSPSRFLTHYETSFNHLNIPFKSSVPKPLKEISPVRELIAILELLTGDLNKSMSLIASRYSYDLGRLVIQIDSKLLESILDGKDIDKPDPIDAGIWKSFKHYADQRSRINSFSGFSEFISDLRRKYIRLPETNLPDDPDKLAAVAWKTLNTVLSSLENYYGNSDSDSGRDWTFQSIYNEVRELVENTIVRPRNRRRSAVEFTSFDTALLRSPAVVFLAGMNELMFPSKPSRDPFLGESIRGELNKLGYTFETAHDSSKRDKFLLDHILYLAKNETYISAPIQDSKGEELAVTTCLADRYPNNWNFHLQTESNIFTYDDLLTEFCLSEDIFSDSQEADKFRDLLKSHHSRGYRAVTSDVDLAETIDSEESRELAMPEAYSASGLKNYARCPFIFFAQNILRLPGSSTSLEKVISPLVRGTAVHEYLCRIFSNEDEKPDLRDILIEDGVDLDDLDFHEESQLESYLQTIENFIEKEIDRLKLSKRNIVSTEYPFGMDGGPDVKVKISDEEKSFRGKIDRIDKLEDGTYAVIDYKTSSVRTKKLFDEAVVFQLPLYLIAAKIMNMQPSVAEIVGIGKSEFNIVNTDAPKLPTIDELIEAGKREIENVVNQIEAGNFPADPPETDFCGWGKCPYFHVCRIDRY